MVGVGRPAPEAAATVGAGRIVGYLCGCTRTSSAPWADGPLLQLARPHHCRDAPASGDV